MKRKILIICLLLPFMQQAQSFTNSTSGAISDYATLNRTITVSGLPASANCTFGITRVCLNINHTYDEDLDITLTSPSGQVIVLSDDNGGSGDNYTNTCFSMTAATSITAGSAPFTGTYKPEGNLSTFNTGSNPNGNWILSVYDDALLAGGTFLNVTLTFAASPPCLPLSKQDCFGGVTICNDASFNGNAGAFGYLQEMTTANRGCLTVEHQSSWYFFSPYTSGHFELTIQTAVDYDFAVWGPMTTIACPPTAAPLRCSYAQTPGNTGMSDALSGGDNTEDAFGNKYVNGLNATVGQKYILLIDNFTANSTPFLLDWTITAGGSLNCTPLPVEFIVYEASQEPDAVRLHWATASEQNSSHFDLAYSTDGIYFSKLAAVPAAGNSSTRQDYYFTHNEPQGGIGYYRLLQYDIDGEIPVEKVVTINYKGTDNFTVHPNPSEGIFTVHTKMRPGEQGAIQLIDFTGKILETRPVAYGQDSHLFHMTHLKGSYILEFVVEGRVRGHQTIVIE